MDKITQQKYWHEVKDIARECLDESNKDTEGARELARDAVDQHHWIIYTFYHMQILEHSRNTDVFFDNFGDTSFSSFSDCTLKCAFAAMEQDVQEEISELLDRADHE